MIHHLIMIDYTILRIINQHDTNSKSDAVLVDDEIRILVASDFVHSPHQIAHLPTSSFSAAKMCPATDAKVVCTWAVSLGKSPANLSFYQVNSGGCDPLKWLCAFSKLRRLCKRSNGVLTS